MSAGIGCKHIPCPKLVALSHGEGRRRRRRRRRRRIYSYSMIL
jgi:hypothetical protein